jgi:hypothetical protein
VAIVPLQVTVAVAAQVKLGTVVKLATAAEGFILHNLPTGDIQLDGLQVVVEQAEINATHLELQMQPRDWVD